MSKAHNGTFSDWAKMGYVHVDGKLVKAETLTAKKVEKIEPKLSSFNGAKIKNAVKSEIDGVKFDSNLEKYMYGLLRGSGIDFEFQKMYLLQEKFRYNAEAIRAITLTVDFWIPGKYLIIDTKGYANDVSPLKFKLLKRLLLTKLETFDFPPPKIEMPKNKKECDLLLNRILYS